MIAFFAQNSNVPTNAFVCDLPYRSWQYIDWQQVFEIDMSMPVSSINSRTGRNA
jgi:hypothetical protein